MVVLLFPFGGFYIKSQKDAFSTLLSSDIAIEYIFDPSSVLTLSKVGNVDLAPGPSNFFPIMVSWNEQKQTKIGIYKINKG